LNAQNFLTLVVLGSNIDPDRNIASAVQFLESEFQITARSAVYISPAVGATDTPDFHNQALTVQSALSHSALQASFREIESKLGRVRTENKNAPRTIDIDLVARFDAEGIALDVPPADPDLASYHHLIHPSAEILPFARLKGDTPPLTDLARALGPAPLRFRRNPHRAG